MSSSFCVGAEKNIHGHRFRAQQDSSNGMSSIRAGSQNGTWRTCKYNNCDDNDDNYNGDNDDDYDNDYDDNVL